MRLSSAAAVALALVFTACDGVDAPAGLRATPTGPGVAVSWVLGGPGLPRVPFPNDVFTRPDPTASTGLRLSLARDTRTLFEDELREGLNDLDGFAGVGPILIPFDADIDLVDLRRRQRDAATLGRAAFAEHAIYLIDLDDGLPVPLGLGAPWTPTALPQPDGYRPRGPRAGEPSLLFETVDEGGEDSDYDGVLDVPTTIDGESGSGAELVDRLTGEWERQTRTLILRPLLPLASGGRYAVVLTERLRGAAGEPIRSPLPFVHPPAQRESLRVLEDHFASHPEIYGDLADRGFEGVAFAWSLTVQSTADDLIALARGLEGDGPLASLHSEFSTAMAAHPMSGGLLGRPCPDTGATLYRASGAVFQNALEASAEQMGLGVEAREALVASYDALDAVVAFTFEAPYLLGDAERPTPLSRFVLDRERGDARVRRDAILAVALLPKSTPPHPQPFTPLLFVHDAGGSKVDVLAHAGLMLRHGVAPVVIDAPEHGLGLADDARVALLNVFGNQCLAPLGQVMTFGRDTDFRGDDRPDPGATAHGPDPFHARDLRRQAALDYVSLARVLSTFDGRMAPEVSIALRGERDPVVFGGDYDRDGSTDPTGDWDGDGTPDLGGGASAIVGIGMGANIAALASAASERITASALISPGGGLAQAWMRSGSSRIRAGALAGVMGPVVWTQRSGGANASTACRAGDTSLRLALSDLDSVADTEVACITSAASAPGTVALVRNLTNGARGCAAFDAEGRIHVPMAADSGDRWSLELYASPEAEMDYASCTFGDGVSAPALTLSTFGVQSGPPGFGRCPECARYRRVEYEVAAPLVFPAGGLGRRRQSPGLLRYEVDLATVLHAADPLMYVSGPAPLIVATVGDHEVPVAAAVRLGRATAALPFLPPDAPSHLAPWTSATSPTPHDRLAEVHVIEGASWLERTPSPGGARFLADPDDLSDGLARFLADGSPDSTGSRPLTPSVPVRAPRFSLVYVAPEGAHGPDHARLFSSTTPFDASQYLINHVTRYITTGEIRHRDVADDHLCLASSTCDFLLE